ncbi:MAG: SAM-dependent methyltransferase [Mariprofundaceae bacterium]|nr:SAM-dependent methyltransferase [Mariprofundaceae bacterium]
MAKALSEQMVRMIEDAGGWVSFEEFMDGALYTPNLGYYESAGIFGEEGDFVTGVDVGPWLALGFADLIEWAWQQLGSPEHWSLIEQGGGEGRLLCAVMDSLQTREMTIPDTIIAIERSGHLGRRQQQAYSEAGLDVQLVSGLYEVDEQENALFFCNELPDAFPVRCFLQREGGLRERGVALGEDQSFRWQEGDALRDGDAPTIASGIMQAWPDGYISEWNPHLASWQAEIARIMRRGFLFCVDYGYAQSEYYRPQRIEGTLLGHLKHRVVEDVLTDPGSRDITAHIDFTALANAGRAVGLDMQCWMAQGAWLGQSPSVQQMVQQAAMQRTQEGAALMAAARRMLLPQGMGELFKLAIQSRGVESNASGALTPAYLNAFNRADALGVNDG